MKIRKEIKSLFGFLVLCVIFICCLTAGDSGMAAVFFSYLVPVMLLDYNLDFTPRPLCPEQ